MRCTCSLAFARKIIAAAAALIVAVSMAVPATATVPSAATPAGVPAPSTRQYGHKVVSANLGSGMASTSLEVPPGLTPVRLRGMVTARLQTGETVQLMVGNRIVTRITASGTSSFTTTLTPGDVQTAGSAGSVYLTVQVLQKNALVCGTPEDTAVVDGLSLDFIGTQSIPTTVASFFDDTVSRIHVLVPAGSTLVGGDGAATAGLLAVATLVHRFGLPGTNAATVDLSTTSPTAPAGVGSDRPADARILRLVPGPDPVVAQLGEAIGVPELTLVGSKAGLAAAVLGFDSASIVLADGSRVTQLTGSNAPGGSLTSTLAAFTGAPTMTLAGFGRSSNYVGVSQASFGGPVGSVSLHLIGTSAVLPPQSQARMSVSWNGYLLASKLLGGGDPIVMDVAVPTALIQRDNGLLLRLDASSGAAACSLGGVAPEVAVDTTASTIRATRGQLLNGGFHRFPQNLSGILTVGFGDGGLSTDGLLAAAGHYVSALQGATSVALSVVGVDGASIVSGPAKSGAALLLDPSGAQLADVSAPLRFAAFRQISGSKVPFGVTVAAPFAALEAFQSSSRDLLVAGAWSPAAADEPTVAALMAKLAVAADSATVGAVDPGSGAVGWAALSNDLLVTSGVTGPVLLDSASLVPQAAVLAAHSGIPGWVWAVVAALLLILLLSVLMHRRREATVEFVRRQAAATAEPGVVLVAGVVEGAIHDGATSPGFAGPVGASSIAIWQVPEAAAVNPPLIADEPVAPRPPAAPSAPGSSTGVVGPDDNPSAPESK